MYFIVFTCIIALFLTMKSLYILLFVLFVGERHFIKSVGAIYWIMDNINALYIIAPCNFSFFSFCSALPTRKTPEQ